MVQTARRSRCAASSPRRGIQKAGSSTAAPPLAGLISSSSFIRRAVGSTGRVLLSAVSAVAGWTYKAVAHMYSNIQFGRINRHIISATELNPDHSVVSRPKGAKDILAPLALTPLLKLPFDVLGFGVLSFLSSEDMNEFRQCSKQTLAAVDTFATICTRQLLRPSHGRRLLVGAYCKHQREYVPTGHNYNNYMLYRFILRFGHVLTAQQRMVSPQYMLELQCRTEEGDNTFITPDMRTCLVDWLLEVSTQYSYPFSVWHYAVMRLDFYLSKERTRRRRLQLIGCVSLLLEASCVGIELEMTVGEACRLCDDQYTEEEFQEAIAAVSRITEAMALEPAPRRDTMSVLDCTLCLYLGICSPASALVHLALRYVSSFHEVGDNDDEHLVLVLLLSDLAVLDYELLQLQPFTIAAAIISYANIIMNFFSQANIVIKANGHVLMISNMREVRGLGGPQRQYVVPKRSYHQFGAKLLQNYILSAPYEERSSIHFCMMRLWKLHSDFLWHTSYNGDPANRNENIFIVKFHTNNFCGMVRKYANPHSCRYRIWQKIGPVPHNLVHKSCSHLLMDIASFGRFDGLSCIISINNGGDSNSIISETEDENINTEIY